MCSVIHCVCWWDGGGGEHFIYLNGIKLYRLLSNFNSFIHYIYYIYIIQILNFYLFFSSIS